MLNRYKEILDNKIMDASRNMVQAEKKFREAKAVYEAAIRERESFTHEVILSE